MAFEPVPFGKYTLYEKLAVGGMAIIYRARIQGVKGFQKDLVIKQILPQYSGMNDFIDMFIDEAKIAVNLNHANIVPVYELGEIDGQLYIAMEYVAGKDLQAILEACEEKKILVPPRIAAYVMIGVCRGLDYAHNKKDDATREPLKIVHRDISPNNVIVSHEGEIKVIDFGIAKASIKVSVTQFGTLKGKMIYMSPEQAAEKPLDARSDVFSAGILLYEMVTGRKPYGGDNFAQTQENVKKASFPPPSEVYPGLPKAIDAIILKAMAREPGERFESAFEFEKALSDFLFSTGKNVYARDVAQFLADLFAEGATPAEAVPRVEPSSKVPTITNIRNLSAGASASANAPVAANVPTNGGPSLTPTSEHSIATMPTDGGRPAQAAVPREEPAPGASLVDIPDEGPAIDEPNDFPAEKVPPPDMPADAAPTPPPVSAASFLGDVDFEIPPPPAAADSKSEANRDTVITKLSGSRAATPVAAVAPEAAVTPPPMRDGVVPAKASTVEAARTNPSSAATKLPSAGRVPTTEPQQIPSWLQIEGPEQTPVDGAWDEDDALEGVTDEGVGVVPERHSDEETAPGQVSRDVRAANASLAEPRRPSPSSAGITPAPAMTKRPSPTSPGIAPPPPPPPGPIRMGKAIPPAQPTPAGMQSPPRGTPAPPWASEKAPPPPAADASKPGLLSRIAKSVSKPAPAAPAPSAPAEMTLEGQYDSPHDFLTNAYATYGDRRGLFLTTKQLDTKLGVDIPLEIDFRSPAAKFQVHGRVIWRRAKEGTSKGKRLPAGLAIEFVDGLPDDLEALFAYLGLP